MLKISKLWHYLNRNKRWSGLPATNAKAKDIIALASLVKYVEAQVSNLTGSTVSYSIWSKITSTEVCLKLLRNWIKAWLRASKDKSSTFKWTKASSRNGMKKKQSKYLLRNQSSNKSRSKEFSHRKIAPLSQRIFLIISLSVQATEWWKNGPSLTQVSNLFPSRAVLSPHQKRTASSLIASLFITTLMQAHTSKLKSASQRLLNVATTS